MMDDIKTQLTKLYARKGELTTNIEITRGQLQIVNEGIAKLINSAPHPSKKELPPKDKKDKKKKNEADKWNYGNRITGIY